MDKDLTKEELLKEKIEHDVSKDGPDALDPALKQIDEEMKKLDVFNKSFKKHFGRQ